MAFGKGKINEEQSENWWLTNTFAYQNRGAKIWDNQLKGKKIQIRTFASTGIAHLKELKPTCVVEERCLLRPAVLK